MGWLRELMEVARPPVESFDALARQCLNQADWPTEIQVRHRSLGALFGKLDRSVDTEWLLHRPTVQRSLARVLGTSRDQLLLHVDQVEHPAPGRHVRLDELPSAPLFDLQKDALFPGLPQELFEPTRWNNLWWVAPSGSGRSIVRAWLEARGLLDTSSRISPIAPEFIEIETPEHAPRARPGLCVASPALPTKPDEWCIVRSADLATTIPSLVDWCCDLGHRGKEIDRSALSRWLIEEPLKNAWLESAGDAIGLIGLCEEHGLSALKRRSARELIQLHLKRRIAETLDPEAPGTAFIKENGVSALVALVRQTLSESEDPWWAARSLEAWAELVPSELKRETDLEWLSLSLAGTGIAAKDVERAARKLPPGAFRLLRTFERLSVLKRISSDSFALRPHWLVTAVVHEAFREIASSAPLEWGEALLRPAASARVSEQLYRRIESGDLTPIDAVIDLDDARTPAVAAATEFAFRALGLSILKGAEAPSEMLQELWDRASMLSVESPGKVAQPRIEYGTLSCLPQTPAMLSNGAYYLSAFALSETLQGAGSRKTEPLNPWSNELEASVRSHVFDAISATLSQASPELGWTAPALDLLARLRSATASKAPLHPLELPHAVLERSDEPLQLWRELLDSDFAQRALVEISVTSPEAVADLIDHIWQALSVTEAKAHQPDFALRAELKILLWRRAPRTALETYAFEVPESVAFEALSEQQWHELIEGCLSRGSTPHSSAFFDAVPTSEFLRLLEADIDLPFKNRLQELYGHSSTELVFLLERKLESDADAAEALLQSTPETATAELIAHFGDTARLSRMKTKSLRVLSRFLHQRVRERARGFREAYALLHDIEERLSAFRSG